MSGSFIVKFPAVDPETSDGVHEVLDMDQELEFRCSSAQDPGEIYLLRYNVACRGGVRSWLRGLLISVHPLRIHTSHHQRIIPYLILVFQAKRY